MIINVQSWSRRLSQWTTEIVGYLRETRSVRQFFKLMQVRLSLSKAGSVVCPSPVDRWVKLHSTGDVVLRSHTTDISVLNELVVWNGYSRPASQIDPPTTIVDLGANTGLAARWLLERWPHARVIAVEPEPGNVAKLRQNLEGRFATILPVAVGGSTRRSSLSTSNGEFAYTLDEGPSNDASIEVQVVTMDDVIRDGAIDSIDLLKVDIEGAERELFADCGTWISRVNSIIVECHDDYKADQLMRDCTRGGVTFRMVDLDRKPEFDLEVATLVRA